MVADITPPGLRGAAYGLRQTLDMVGAFIGPLLAIGLMWLTAGHFQAVFWVAVVPAVLAVGVLLVFVREPEQLKTATRPHVLLSRHTIAALGGGFWWVAGVAIVFTLARFSEAFLILRATEAGLSPVWVPLVLVLMAAAYSLSAYPAGALSDRGDRIIVLIIGMTVLILADLILALVPGMTGLTLGVVFWGVHMGFTQGVFAAMVADSATPELRGTAFGVFHLTTGLALLLASVVAGGLWDELGYQGTFVYGAILATLALLALTAVRRKLPRFRRPVGA